MPKPQSHERPYHHGDLRRAIVKAALEILRETQSLEFSLRELARRAGVSHNAPYKHFAEKRELLAAVSAAGFEMLAKRMTSEIAGLGRPREQLFAMLRAYIDHGVENPALYSLMFGGYLSGPDRRPPGHGTGRSRQGQVAARRRDQLRAVWDAPFRMSPATNGRLRAPSWRAGPSCMVSLWTSESFWRPSQPRGLRFWPSA